MAFEGNAPKICYNNRLVPICGRYFWDNSFGARLFCKMLGKSDGIWLFPKIPLDEDAYYVGRCSSTDTHINKCSAASNWRTLGGSQFANSASCYKGSEAVVHVKCSGKYYLLCVSYST